MSEYRLFDLVKQYQPYIQTPIPAALSQCGIFPIEHSILGNHVFGPDAVELLDRICFGKGEAESGAAEDGTTKAATSDGVQFNFPQEQTFQARVCEGLDNE